MLTWKIWTSCPQPRFRMQDLHTLLAFIMVYNKTSIIEKKEIFLYKIK